MKRDISLYLKDIVDAMGKAEDFVGGRDMAGMRDKVSHFYFGVSLKTVWLVIKEDIPRLEPVIRKVLNDVFQEVSEEKT